MKTEIGVQCYCVRSELMLDKKATIDQLHRIGFEVYEPMILPIAVPSPFPEVVWSMNELQEKVETILSVGIRIPSAHIVWDPHKRVITVETMADTLRKIHKIAGTKYFVFSTMFSSLEDAKELGEYLNKLQSLLCDDALCILYHNHDTEFKKIHIDGEEKSLLDCFLEYAGKDVLLELDIGWAAFAEQDIPVARKYSDRIAILHLKDFTANALALDCERDDIPNEGFAPIGFGAVHTAEILEMAKTMPNFSGLAIVDQDRSAIPMLDALKQGYDYLNLL